MCSPLIYIYIYIYIYIQIGPGSVVGIATGYGLDGTRIESRWGARFSAPVQTGPGAYPASCTMGTGSFPGGRGGRGVTLTSPPSSAAVLERVELQFYSPKGPSWTSKRVKPTYLYIHTHTHIYLYIYIYIYMYIQYKLHTFFRSLGVTLIMIFKSARACARAHQPTMTVI